MREKLLTGCLRDMSHCVLEAVEKYINDTEIEVDNFSDTNTTFSQCEKYLSWKIFRENDFWCNLFINTNFNSRNFCKKYWKSMVHDFDRLHIIFELTEILKGNFPWKQKYAFTEKYFVKDMTRQPPKVLRWFHVILTKKGRKLLAFYAFKLPHFQHWLWLIFSDYL